MDDNPLKSDAEREARIRARAYRLWEDEGRPYGRDVEIWERARELDAIDTNSIAGRPRAGCERRSYGQT